MDISQIKDTAGNRYLIKDAQCRSDLSTLSGRYLGLATQVLDQGFRIDDIEVAIPTGTSTSNKLVNSNTLNTGLATKQDLLTAGANITITNGVISANVPGMSVEVVSVLPSVGDTDKIYLVPKTTALTSNTYDEYIYVNNNFELIGDTEIDLTNYFTKAETAAAINAGDAAVTAEVQRVEGLVGINTANITSLQTGKLDKLTAGSNISISNTNVISATLLNPQYTYVSASGGTKQPGDIVFEITNPSFAYEYIMFCNIQSTNPLGQTFDLTLVSSYGTQTYTFNPIIQTTGTPPLSTLFCLKLTSAYNPGVPLVFIELLGYGGSLFKTMPTNMLSPGNLVKMTLTYSSGSSTITTNTSLYRRFF